MTTLFDERERAAEALFALDEELRFLALARRNKMLAAWMCERLSSIVARDALRRGPGTAAASA